LSQLGGVGIVTGRLHVARRPLGSVVQLQQGAILAAASDLAAGNVADTDTGGCFDAYENNI